MKASVFVDTSAWYALSDTSDANHRIATEFLKQAMADYKSLVTTNHVIGETYTLMRFSLGHSRTIEFLDRLRQSPRVERIFIPPKWEDEAYSLLEKYNDQEFSFVDASSFIAMRTLGIKDAYSFDRHFVAAGFNLVPDRKGNRER
ncbi:MAG: PIN domain-containing protein [Dehalococcoidia bacterium]|nr:PIN domain-containing protein [Dehalococcoidia bacterium]